MRREVTMRERTVVLAAGCFAALVVVLSNLAGL
jgi:hypothetical protein